MRKNSARNYNESKNDMRLYELLEPLYVEFDRWLESTEITLSQGIISAIAETETVISNAKKDSELVDLISRISKEAAGPGPYSDEFWNFFNDYRERFNDDKYISKQFFKPLSIPELRRQGVTDRQVCTIYGFTYTDKEGVRRPDYATLAAELNEPGSVVGSKSYEYPAQITARKEREARAAYRGAQIDRINAKRALMTAKHDRTADAEKVLELLKEGVTSYQIAKIAAPNLDRDSADAFIKSVADVHGLPVVRSYDATPAPVERIKEEHAKNPSMTYQDLADVVSTPDRVTTWEEVRDALLPAGPESAG